MKNKTNIRKHPLKIQKNLHHLPPLRKAGTSDRKGPAPAAAGADGNPSGARQ